MNVVGGLSSSSKGGQLVEGSEGGEEREGVELTSAKAFKFQE